MAERWLPNYNEFFHSLGKFIESSERQLLSQSCDSLEFFIRRLDEYQQVVSTLLSRLNETYENNPAVLSTFGGVSFLRNRLGTLRQQFEDRFFSVQDDNSGEEQHNIRRGLEPHTAEGPGRPRLQITQEQLEALHNVAGFRWNDIARILQVSDRTLRRRSHEMGMPVEGREFSQLTDGQLDNVVRQALQNTPSAGLRLVQGSLRQQGLKVQRARALQSLRRVDPVTPSLRNTRRIIRTKYNVASPNSLW